MDSDQLAGFQSVLFKAGDIPILDHLLRDGQALVLEGGLVSGFPDWMVEIFDLKSVLVAPLICKGRPLGLLAVDSPGADHAFTPRDIAMVEGIAGHAAMAIDNARLYELAMRRADQLSLLYEAGRGLSTSFRVDDLLATIAETIGRLAEADWCTIWLADEAGDGPVLAHRWPPDMEAPARLSEASLELARRGIAAGRTLLTAPGDPDQSARPASGPFVREMSVPLLTNGRVTGVIVLAACCPGAFDDTEVRMLEALASQAATALENSRMFRQISEGKRAWEETFDAITDAICLRDRDCHVLRANRAMSRMVGGEFSNLIGARLCELIPELERECGGCLAGQREEAGRGDGVIELRRVGPDASVLTVRDYPVQAADQGVLRWVTVIKDVTVERRMQDSLILSERLRALGEMATGVAHDFNNLLAAILARAELSLLEERCAEGLRAFETIRRVALDGVEMVRRIQDYARVRHDLQRRDVDVNEVVQAAVDLARHKWKDGPERAGIRLDLSLNLHPIPAVPGSAAELREVLINLIFNAVDAMPAGGRLTLSTGMVGDRVVVTVADTGLGMTEDIQRRIFDPFFTTKDEAGSGLGLSISYGIVARYGGDIVVQSSPGAGTTFMVRLPFASAEESAPPRPADVHALPVPPARVLLVDDDVAVLQNVANLLRRDRHWVTALASPRDALAVFRPGAFDYVITDLGMPELNGWELAQALRQLDPTVPIVLLTGWHAELANEHTEAQGISAMLSKPCTLTDLRRVMADHPPADADRCRPDVAAPAAPGAVSPLVAERSLRILAVDDQRQFVELLAERLRLEGHEVTLAFSGQEALDLAAEGIFDLMLVDLRLPDMLGVEVLAALRAREPAPYLVLMSGLAADSDSDALGGVADEVLPKPWRSDELAAVLGRALRRSTVPVARDA